MDSIKRIKGKIAISQSASRNSAAKPAFLQGCHLQIMHASKHAMYTVKLEELSAVYSTVHLRDSVRSMILYGTHTIYCTVQYSTSVTSLCGAGLCCSLWRRFTRCGVQISRCGVDFYCNVLALLGHRNCTLYYTVTVVYSHGLLKLQYSTYSFSSPWYSTL